MWTLGKGLHNNVSRSVSYSAISTPRRWKLWRSYASFVLRFHTVLLLQAHHIIRGGLNVDRSKTRCGFNNALGRRITSLASSHGGASKITLVILPMTILKCYFWALEKMRMVCPQVFDQKLSNFHNYLLLGSNGFLYICVCVWLFA